MSSRILTLHFGKFIALSPFVRCGLLLLKLVQVLQKDKGELFLVSNFIWINLMGVTGLHADML